MTTPEKRAMENVKASVMGLTPGPYQYQSPSIVTKGLMSYHDALQKLLGDYQRYLQRSPEGQKALVMAQMLVDRMKTYAYTAQSLAEVARQAENIVTTLKRYLDAENHKESVNLCAAISSDILTDFPETTKKPHLLTWLSASSPAHTLQKSIFKATTVEAVERAWQAFQKNVGTSIIATELQLGKFRKINDLLAGKKAFMKSLVTIIASIEEVPMMIENDTKSEALENEQTAQLDAMRSNLQTFRTKIQRNDESIHTSYDPTNDCDIVVLTICQSDGDILRKQLRIVGHSSKLVIDNKTTFHRHNLNAAMLTHVFADMRKENEIAKSIGATESQSNSIATAPRTNWQWITKFGKSIKNTWHRFTNFFSGRRSRRVGFAATIAAMALGTILASRQTKPVEHDQAAINHPTTTSPTRSHAETQAEAPTPHQQIHTQASPTMSSRVLAKASTSVGSRYGTTSHNHNTDETLQRMVKSMGFNSVQTKVIATRLDHQLRAARDLQAPHSHTQVNQQVILEQDSTGSNIRLSVQSASGRTIYQTGWFARSVGFRNFVAR